MKKLLILFVLPLFIVSGCTQTEQYTVGGALAGSAAGAIIGHQHRDRDGKGALIGAAIGALAGTAIGKSQEVESLKKGEQIIVICPSCNSRVDVTGFPPHSTVECPNCKSQFTY